MVKLTRAFSLLAVVSAGLAASVKRDVVVVKDDMNKISTAVTALAQQIDTFNTSSSLTLALGIQNACHGLVVSLTAGTTDVNACPQFSPADTTAILDQVQSFEPKIEDAFKKLSTELAKFEALHIANIKADICTILTSLKSVTVAFSTALVGKCSTDQHARATGLQTSILASSDPAFKVYCA